MLFKNPCQSENQKTEFVSSLCILDILCAGARDVPEKDFLIGTGLPVRVQDSRWAVPTHSAAPFHSVSFLTASGSEKVRATMLHRGSLGAHGKDHPVYSMSTS